MKTPEQYLKIRIRILLIFFITGLVLSGITAFPIESELSLIATNHPTNSLQQWINTVYHAVAATNARYPFMPYGTDWLAFAHIVIAIAFVGPLRDPVRNIWVLQFGMIACVLIIPLTFIAGPVRDIPIGWSLVDCSFGVVGIIPLYICYRYTKKLEEDFG
ncbi:MAG: hypothetical protein JST50_20260 [Bacteroidetes bacterium]|jgi:hypothetical protein|nr:hypothetical protein [Bacteroidota bacterium]